MEAAHREGDEVNGWTRGDWLFYAARLRGMGRHEDAARIEAWKGQVEEERRPAKPAEGLPHERLSTGRPPR